MTKKVTAISTHIFAWDGKRCKRIKNKDKRGQITNKTSIDERPAIVHNKDRIGDWETDTVIGKNHKGALVTAVERKTKFTCIAHVPKQEADLMAKALIDEMLKPFKKVLHTITSDSRKEFAEYQKIARELETEFYFAHPYCSWERGLNENTNGLIRQYFPNPDKPEPKKGFKFFAKCGHKLTGKILKNPVWLMLTKNKFLMYKIN